MGINFVDTWDNHLHKKTKKIIYLFNVMDTPIINIFWKYINAAGKIFYNSVARPITPNSNWGKTHL